MAEKPKRRLKPPQSLREKANEANQPHNKKKRNYLKTRLVITAPFVKCSKFFGRYKAFRIIGKIIVPTFFRNSWKEIRMVTWPDRKTSIRLTMAVLAFAIVIGAIVATLDYGLSHLFKNIILGKHN